MKEYATRIELTKGLRPDKRIPFGSTYLETCYNLKASPQYGLIGIDVPTYPVVDHAQSVDTQFIEGSSLLLADVSDTAVELFELSTGDWSLSADLLTAGAVPSTADGTTSTAIPLGGLWQHIEGAGTWILVNTAGLLTNCALFGTGWFGSTYTISLVPTTVCMFQGRGIYGGLRTTGSYLSSTYWTEIWDTWRGFRGDSGITSDEEVGREYLMWGPPSGGSMDIPFGLELSLLSGFNRGRVDRLVIEAIRAGEIGFARIPFRGRIRSVKRLGNRVVVYGTEGVGLLVQEDKGFRIDPLLDTGIIHRDCVAGDDQHHMFVDKKSRLWLIQNEYIPILKGYEDHLANLTYSDTTPLMSYDSINDDFYITDGILGVGTERSYVFSNGELAESRYRPSTILTQSGNFYATYTNGVEAFEVVLHAADMGRRALKTIQTVEVAYRLCRTVKVAVEYRHGATDYYTRSTLIPVNKEGVAWPMITAPDLRIVLTGVPSSEISTDATIDDIVVHWKGPDKRVIRGLTEQQNATTSGDG